MTHRVAIHPLWLRIWHWINLIAVVLMVTSGWQVYNASRIFGQIRFPASITLGRWLGGALLWHFAAMWLLALNLALYVIANTLT
ncbi:thiosulfate reductase cytochrome b subunit [Paraburkholderia sp. CI3]